MTTYGLQAFGNIIISTGTSGSVGSEEPSGDIVYLCGSISDGTYQLLDNPKHLPLGESYTNMTGKRDWRYQVKDCLVAAYGGSSNTTSFNNVFTWLKNRQKVAVNPIYLFEYNHIDATYKKLGDGTRYLKGHIKTIAPGTNLDGNVHYFRTINFEESLR